MHEKIYEIASHAVSPTEAEQPILDTLCTAAGTELTMGLREGVTPEDCGNIYVFSAALIAVSEMMLLRGANGIEQFTAGEVSVKQTPEKTCVAAASLRCQANALMASFLKDEAFAFMGVQG